MPEIHTSKLKKTLFLIFGTISLVLAYIGVIFPGIPGIPFILLTAWFYVRSSDKMYNWILNHRVFGKLLDKFSQKEKVPLGFKLFVVSQLWVSITVSLIWLIHNIYFQILTIIVGIIVSIVIFRMKKTKF
jgi:uncharacterized membrane protein YbaN (DUF454 family)